MTDAISKPKPKKQVFEFGSWTLTAVESHILQSEGKDRTRHNASVLMLAMGISGSVMPHKNDRNVKQKLHADRIRTQGIKYEHELSLPQLPEMVFAENVLRLEHTDGFGIEFNALDALKQVDFKNDPLQVAVSEAWKNARADCEYIKQVLRPFDWTFSTDYKGTVFSKTDKLEMKVAPTSDRIDLEKLKQREKILFYQDILLFEDELADNGTSMLSVKIRVMPSGVFILLRLFMRVDNVMIRVNDTRLYHEAGTDFLLREYTSRDDKVTDIKVPPHLFTDPNEISGYLTIRSEAFEKLSLPPAASSTTATLPMATTRPAPKSSPTNTEGELR